EFTSYALEADGTLWAWGGDGDGELGATPGGSQPCGTCEATPIQVSAPPLDAVAAIAQGSAAQHAVAIAGPRVSTSASSLAFGTAAQSTLSAPRTVTLTNSGAAPLRLSGLVLTGAEPGDFLVSSSTCDHAIAVGASCVLQAFFAPQAPGARSAVLQIQTNEVSSPTAVTLSGTGGALPAGVPGISGPTGPAGPQGKPGKVELVTCTSSTKTEKVGKRRKRVTVTRCAGRLVSGTLKLTKASESVELTRADVVYARGWETPAARGRAALALAPVRPLRPGAYTLVAHGTRHGHRTVTRRGIHMVR
ncbi:MAG: choice-of-anchor D domain-containing protein, partial [Solirubrobacteraceae bacterium]